MSGPPLPTKCLQCQANFTCRHTCAKCERKLHGCPKNPICPTGSKMATEHPINSESFDDDDQFCAPCYVTLLGYKPGGIDTSGFAMPSLTTAAPSSSSSTIRPAPKLGGRPAATTVWNEVSKKTMISGHIKQTCNHCGLSKESKQAQTTRWEKHLLFFSLKRLLIW